MRIKDFTFYQTGQSANRQATRPAPYRLLIVDDHPIVRRGLGELVADEPDLEVCGEAADLPGALQQLEETRPDLVIIDISLQSGHGLDLIEKIKARNKRVKMLVASMHDELLYAERALRLGASGYINKEDVKIWTAEDPVEITQRGLRQMQMNRKAGVTFASAMRSFLRAEPDVIMIGEMRDSETAQTGVEASLTGHLVFSTLHTNSAPETVTRLIEMGIDPYSFADAMLGVLAQRLVRTLCKGCKEEYKITKKEFANLRDEYGAPELFDELGYKSGHKIFRARKNGCVKCSKVGFRGRMGIHELLVNTDDIKSLMYRKAKAMEIRDLAIEQGMRTLKQDGIEKVLMGHTTLDEVRGVCSR